MIIEPLKRSRPDHTVFERMKLDNLFQAARAEAEAILSQSVRIDLNFSNSLAFEQLHERAQRAYRSLVDMYILEMEMLK